MTRTRERLIVCGAEGERGRPEGCWYDLVHSALQPISEEEPADDGEGNVWRYRKTAPADGKSKAASTVTAPVTDLPKWLDHAAPVEPPALVPMSPSADYDEAAPVRATASRRAERLKALERGRIVHRLLQSLPDIPRDARAEAARRHLARTARILSAEECEEAAEQVGRILDDARFAALFSPGSRAEVPVVGRIARLAVSGQVDRLVVTDAAVLIADYKTNHPAPRRLEDVPQPYLRQLALYRAVLAQLYPDRPVRAALIWTDVPDLMEVSAEAMEQALAALTSA